MTDAHDGTTPPHDPDQPEQPDVGSVGEEAAKLFGALSEWARDQVPGGGGPAAGTEGTDGTAGDRGASPPGLGESLQALAGHAARAVREVDEHVATGAPECAYCPVCRTVHVVRSATPEVRTHLATAASSLLHAFAGLVATLPPPAAGTGDAHAGGDFQRIDLDDDPEPGPHDDRPGGGS